MKDDILVALCARWRAIASSHLSVAESWEKSNKEGVRQLRAKAEQLMACASDAEALLKILGDVPTKDPR